jgi:hypothetical protein
MVLLEAICIMKPPPVTNISRSERRTMDALRYTADFLVTWRGHMAEHRSAGAVHHIEAIQNQNMEMRIEVQRVREALNESDGAATSLAVRGRNARHAADGSKDRSYKDLQYIPHQGRVIGEAIAQCIRNRWHPLADGHFGENTIHQMRGRVEHAPCST